MHRRGRLGKRRSYSYYGDHYSRRSSHPTRDRWLLLPAALLSFGAIYVLGSRLDQAEPAAEKTPGGDYRAQLGSQHLTWSAPVVHNGADLDYTAFNGWREERLFGSRPLSYPSPLRRFVLEPGDGQTNEWEGQVRFAGPADFFEIDLGGSDYGRYLLRLSLKGVQSLYQLRNGERVPLSEASFTLSREDALLEFSLELLASGVEFQTAGAKVSLFEDSDFRGQPLAVTTNCPPADVYYFRAMPPVVAAVAQPNAEDSNDS